MTYSTDQPSHLSPAAAQIARGLTRSRLIAMGCLLVLAVLGWAYLGLLVAGHLGSEEASRLGPGMGVFDLALRHHDFGPVARAIYVAICRPTFGHDASSFSVAAIAVVFAMWVAMTLAMMLPTAGPMMLTYAEIADAAIAKGEPVVSPLALTAGYIFIWIGFAVGATALQAALTQAGLLDPAMGAVSPLFSAAIFLAAGAYQFSALKHACVTFCQRPFPFFLANWSTERAGVFRLGLRQGVYCLGCCWAMMLLMFAVGVMNVIWMAALGIIMAIEKLAATTRFSRVLGVAFGLIGIVLMGTAIAAHWPR